MSHFLLIKMVKVILVTHTKYYTTLIYIYEWNNKHMAMLCNIPLNIYDKVVTLKMLRLLIHSLVKDDIH